MINKKTKFLWPLLLLALATPLLFIHSANRRLAKSDEVAYAAGALEISRGENPIYPQGELSRYRNIGKPPGGLWPMALSFKIFGHSPLSARLPTLLAALLLLWLLYYFALMLADHPLAGALAVLLLLAQAKWLELARKIWLENLLSASFLLAILLHLKTIESKGKQRLVFLLLGAFTLSYGLWVKHAVGLAAFMAITLAELSLFALSFFKAFRLDRKRAWSALIWTVLQQLLALVLFAPWWIYFSLERGGLGRAVGKIGAKLQAESNSKRTPGALWKSLSQLESSYLLIGAAIAAALLLSYFLLRLYRPSANLDTAEALELHHAKRRRILVVLVLLGLLTSHLLAFGLLSQKLRNWYLLPIVPLFPLLSAAFIGRIFSILRDWRPRTGTVVSWTLTLMLLFPIGQGLRASYAMAKKDPGLDRFAQLAQRWRKEKIKRLVVDKKNWDRPGYFKPMLYFYFSPLPMAPMDMRMPCDSHFIHKGEFALVHWTQMKCLQSRVQEDIHVTPWWRVIKVK